MWLFELGKMMVQIVMLSFYADDGLIQNENIENLQNDINNLVKQFEKVGLETNTMKTKFMIINAAKPTKSISDRAYKFMCTKKE